MAVIGLDTAVGLLKDGQLVVLPTDTVFGVVADSRNESAVRKVFELKGRSSANPLPVLISSLEMLEDLVVVVTDDQRMLMKKFWPGALTLVFRKAAGVSDLITAGRSTIGVRMPNYQDTLKVIEALGRPIVATSVNVSGAASLNNIAEIERVFPDLAVMVGDQPLLGLESTVLDLTGAVPVVLREGYLRKEQIEEVLGGF